jgi:hypothetical protein
MYLGDRLGHLTYSTLVHSGDTWEEMSKSLTTFVPAVKQRVSPDQAFGVSLRLSGSSADTLVADAGERARLRDFLQQQDLYVYTVNAFPHGPFKGRVVMEDVYEPDWATKERVLYTCNVADILADITPPEISPTIQTAPLAYRPKVTTDDDVAVLTRNLLHVVGHLAELEKRTGRRVKLALEPEPFCFLETTAETIEYFNTHVYSSVATEYLVGTLGLAASEVHSLVRRYLGVVFDICHQSVEFEDIAASLADLRAAGVPVFKLQAASALWVPDVTPEIVAELVPFTDTIYLSQTTERRQNGELIRHLTLADAIEAWRASPALPREWRTHIHVPVFLDQIGGFRTTRDGISAALAAHVQSPISDHLEIETYTWDVLPPALKTGDITEYVAREIEWVRGELTNPAPHG